MSLPTRLCSALFCCSVLAAPAAAQDRFVEAGDVLVRFRGIAVVPDEDVRSISVIGGDVGIETSFDPEVDFSYFLTDNLALELIAAIPRHEARVKDSALGDVDLGKFRLLPPTLSLQYHLPVTPDFKPYVGVGINATFFIEEDAAGAPVTRIRAKDTLGWGLQAGFDWRVSGPWFANVDVKRLFLDTRVSVNEGAIVARGVDIDPWIVGVGFGYRF